MLRPEDEIQLWSDLAVSSTCPAALQQRAAAISRIFAPVVPKLQKLRKSSVALPEEEVLDLVEDVHQVLEALWELEAPDASGGCWSLHLPFTFSPHCMHAAFIT